MITEIDMTEVDVITIVTVMTGIATEVIVGEIDPNPTLSRSHRQKATIVGIGRKKNKKEDAPEAE